MTDDAPRPTAAQYYNAHPRSELRRTLDQVESFPRLRRQELLHERTRERLAGMRAALVRPMRLYAHVDRVRDGGAQLDAQCAELRDALGGSDARKAIDLQPFSISVLLDDAAGLQEEDLAEVVLQESGHDLPLAFVRWTPRGGHSAVDGLDEILRVAAVRTLDDF